MPFIIKEFNNLSVYELYDVLKLRAEVFIVEQNCPYLDLDDKDLKCKHILYYENQKLLAYSRIVPTGISYSDFPSIGRVANHESIRGKGLGKELMKFSIKACNEIYPNLDIIISAQQYLLKFYNELGFNEEGEIYLEDEIPHIQMRLKPIA